jgi:hypothetical protein
MIGACAMSNLFVIKTGEERPFDPCHALCRNSAMNGRGDTVSDQLHRLADAVPEGGAMPLGEILERLGPSGFGLLILLLTLPAMIPIPGPFGMVFGSCLAFVGLQVLFGARRFWLPERMRRLDVSARLIKTIAEQAARWLTPMERFLRPRRMKIITFVGFRPFYGVPILLMAMIIALPLPLGNILPVLTLIVLALALLARDGLAVLAGLVLAVVSLAWTVFLIFAGATLVHSATVWIWSFL